MDQDKGESDNKEGINGLDHLEKHKTDKNSIGEGTERKLNKVYVQ